MAYATSNPPKLMVPRVGDAGVALWSYTSADDDGTVNGAGYITNALQLGMKVGDHVLVFDTATPRGSLHTVLTFTSNAANLGFSAVA